MQEQQCSVVGCQVDVRAGKCGSTRLALCGKHYRRYKKHGDPTVSLRSPGTSYRNYHAKVAAAKGKATAYRCVDCGGRADHWSQIKGTLGDEVEHYEPRCVACHNVYDRDLRPKGERVWSARLNYEIADEIRERYAAGGVSIRQLAARYGVTYLPVWNIINRKAWVRD